MMKWQQTASRTTCGIRPLSINRKRRQLTTKADHRRRATAVEVETLEVRTLLSSATAQLIKDVNAVPTFPSSLTPAGSNLFYLVEDSTDSGVDLEVTNPGGNQLLMDFPKNASGASGTPSELTSVGNDLFFTTSSSGPATLWTSDGTSAGTVQVSIPNPSVDYITSLSDVGNTLVFATESDTSSTDYQLWAIAPGSSTPTMLTDSKGSYPSPIDTAGSTLYLSVGGNLWTTDGTAANTQEVMDSHGNPVAAPADVFDFNSHTYAFVDSQSQTTISVLGSSGLTPVFTLATRATAPVVIGSKFYFAGGGSGSSSDSQLWMSDGTLAGTKMLEDIGAISDKAVPSNLIDADGTLFFTITGSDGLSELWKSNGTSQGTTLVKDLGLSPNFAEHSSGYSYYGYGSTSTYSSAMAAVGSNLFFTADDGTHGAELWVDNVATGTTQLVKDINPGSTGSDPNDFVAFNGLLYFAAYNGSTPETNQLWSSDGTAANTTMVASFSPAVTQGASVFYGSTSDDILIGSDLLLPLNDGVHGTTLWSTDGTAAGTTLLALVDPSTFASRDGTAYFLGTNSTSQLGLWSTNGTAAGTSEVKDLSSFGSSSYYYGSASQLVATSGKLYFTTSDGNGGTDLWASNGTPGGTSIVKDFAVPSVSTGNRVSVSELTAFGSDLAFIANDGTHGSQLWISDGTQNGTQMLTHVNATASTGSTDVNGADPGSLTVVGSKLYFIADTPGSSTSTTQGLWVSNGTPGGTTEFATIPSLTVPNQTLTATGSLSNLTAVGNELFFSISYSYYNSSTSTDTEVAQLWSSDGTDAHTAQLDVPGDGSTFTSLSHFKAVGNQLLFTAVEGSSGTELWASDGTASGTTLLKVIDPSNSSYNYNYNYYYGNSGVGASLVANGVLYFASDDGTHGQELWESNGTGAGTYLVDDINPGPSGSDPIPLGVLNGQVVLIANDGIHGSELMTLSSSSQTAVPGLLTIPAQDVTVGESLQLDISDYAYDSNNPGLPLTYTLGTGAPSGATIDPTTGVLSWTTTADQFDRTDLDHGRRLRQQLAAVDDLADLHGQCRFSRVAIPGDDPDAICGCRPHSPV